jgi:hypothetical protein
MSTGGGLKTKRIVFLNALPLNAFPKKKIRLLVEPLDLGLLRFAVEEGTRLGYAVEHYIRHPATLELLQELGVPVSAPSSGLYRYEEGDIIIVVTLKAPLRGAEQRYVSIEDIEVFSVTELKPCEE